MSFLDRRLNMVPLEHARDQRRVGTEDFTGEPDSKMAKTVLIDE